LRGFAGARPIRLSRQYESKTILIEDQASGTQFIQALRHEQPQGVAVAFVSRSMNLGLVDHKEDASTS